MQRGFQLGLLLLAVQLFQEGLGNIPAVTLAVLGFNVYLYMFPAAPLMKACVSLQYVYRDRDWRRLFLSPLHHVDDWHLYFNMVSFLLKGLRLERRLGGGWFLYLLSVFSLLTGLVYLLLQAALTTLMKNSDLLAGFIDVSSHSNECAVGFSGVLFALKVVTNHYNPGGVTFVLNIRVSNRFASWVELVLIYLIAPGTSLIGHLAGILVGLLYTVGPLETFMKTSADFVSSGGNNPRPSSYFNFSGYSGTTRGYSEEPQHAEDHAADDASESDIAGLTEEEQLEMAIRNSLNDGGYSGTTRGYSEEPQHAEDHAADDASESDIAGLTEEEQLEMAIRNSLNDGGYSGTTRGYSEDPQHAEDHDDASESDIAGLTEEEQLEMAIRNSLNDGGRTRQRRTARPAYGVHPTAEEVRLEELRRRRLRRFGEPSNQGRRRL